ncbi:hypothetical protein D3C72_2229350 [compost metagenome]
MFQQRLNATHQHLQIFAGHDQNRYAGRLLVLVSHASDQIAVAARHLRTDAQTLQMGLYHARRLTMAAGLT